MVKTIRREMAVTGSIDGSPAVSKSDRIRLPLLTKRDLHHTYFEIKYNIEKANNKKRFSGTESSPSNLHS